MTLFRQNFLAGSASNVGALALEQLCQYLFLEMNDHGGMWSQTIIDQTMPQVRFLKHDFSPFQYV